MVKVLWLSRHDATPEQVAVLSEKLGAPVETVKVSMSVANAAEVVQLMHDNGCEEMVVVLPPKILMDLTNPRICPVAPIVAEMDRVPTGQKNEKGEDEFEFVFKHFERVHKFVRVATPL